MKTSIISQSCYYITNCDLITEINKPTFIIPVPRNNEQRIAQQGLNERVSLQHDALQPAFQLQPDINLQGQYHQLSVGAIDHVSRHQVLGQTEASCSLIISVPIS